MALRVILGKHPISGVMGLWISKPTKDATSTDPADFLFDPTRYGTRLLMSGVIGRASKTALADTTSSSGGYTTYTGQFAYPIITHSLGYIPLFLISGQSARGITETELFVGQYRTGVTDVATDFRVFSQTYKRLHVASGVWSYWGVDYNVGVDPYYDVVSNQMVQKFPTTYSIFQNRWI